MKRLALLLMFTIVFNMCAVSTTATSLSDNWVPDIVSEPDLRTRTSFTIVAKTDSNMALVNNGKLVFENDIAFLHNGETYISLRFLAQSWNCVWEWAEKTQEFVVEFGTDVLTFKAGSTVMFNGNTDIELNHEIILNAGELCISLDSIEAVFDKSTFCTETGYVFISRKGMELSDEQCSEIISGFDKVLENPEPLCLYVSPNGSDDNPGTEEQPFGTIAKAKTEIRRLIADGKMNSDINVYLREGTYYTDKTLKFTDKDSGQNFFDVVWQSYPGENAVISGAVPVKEWKPYKNGIYKAYVGEGLSINSLYENGEMLTKSRYPNAGENVYEGWLHPEKFPEDKRTIKFPVGSIPEAKDISALEVVMWPGNGIMWFLNYRTVIHADWERGFFSLDRRVYSGSGTFVCDTSYYFVQGAIEFLDTPGEFHYDKKTGYIYYYPKGEITSSVISYGSAEHVLEFRGKSEKQLAHNIKFAGVELMNTAQTEKITGFEDDGYEKLDFDEDALGHGVRFNNSENITIENCRIHDVTNSGVYFRLINRNNRVYGNDIYNVGGDGISLFSPGLYRNIEEGDLSVPFLENKSPLANYGHYIANNCIRRATLIYYQASGISGYHIGQGDVHVANNKVSDIKRIGINWGVSKERNYIEYNDISNVMNGSEDGGAIYVHFEPVDDGAVVRNNWLHDSNAWKGGVAAVYFDENANSTIMERNISENFGSADGSARFIGNLQKGIDMKLINNVAANNDQSDTLASFNYSDSHKVPATIDVTMKNNIMYDSGFKAINISKWRDGYFREIDYNIYYNKDREVVNASPSMSIAEWQEYDDKKYDQHSYIQDPLFCDEENGDYRLMYNSPALKQGTKSIAINNVGLKEDFIYVDSTDKPNKLYIKESGTLGQSATINMVEGAKAELETKIRTLKGYIVDTGKGKLTFETDNASVATVDNDGMITANGTGIATITARYVQDSYVVSSFITIIVGDEVTDIGFNQDKRVFPENSSYDLVPYIQTKFGQVGASSLDELSFESTNEAVARIGAKGVLHSGTEGKVTITAKARIGNKTYTESFDVTVLKNYINDIQFKLEPIYTIGKYASIPIEALDTKGKYVDLSGASIETSVSDTEILDVISADKKGIVIMPKNPGAAMVQITASLGGIQVLKSARVISGGESKLPEGWSISNYGNANGFAFVEGDKVFLSSTGNDVYSRADDATFVHKTVNAKNYTIYGKIENVSNVGNSNTAHGLMIRANDSADSEMVHLRSQGGQLIMVYRNEKNPSSNHIAVTRTHPIELKLVKEGNKISAYYVAVDAHSSVDNKWSLLGSVEINCGESTFAGVAGYSQVKDVYAESNTSGFSIEEN